MRGKSASVRVKPAKSLQAADKLSMGAAYQSSGYVVVDEAGRPLSPHALTSRWARMLIASGVPAVRLHDARHTCGTLMHLEGVPIAVIAAWLDTSKETPHHMLSVNSAELVRLTRRVCGFVAADGSVSGR